MASLLIIGGSGFFGKSFLDAYSRGLLTPWGIDRIIVLARNAQNLSQDYPVLVGPSITLINGDICSCADLPQADFIIHAAASTDATHYFSRPEVERKNIQAGTYHFCDLAKQFDVRSQIVYCSSGAVYGQQPPEVTHLSEDFRLGPLEDLVPNKRDYAAAKRDGEAAIQELGSEGLSVSIARCFAFVGAYLPRTLHFAIGNFIEDGLQGRPIEIKAQHAVYRSYLYADDLVLWLMHIATGASAQCPIFNVGSDEAIEVRDLARCIGDQFGVPVKPTSLGPGHSIDRYVPSVSKAKNLLNLELQWTLDQAITATISQILALK